MTGWRLGWLVLPEELVAPVEKLAQNLYICASHHRAACGAGLLRADCIAEYERRRGEFRRRDFVVPALHALGLKVPVLPDGAFYAWADCSGSGARSLPGSWDFCFDMMRAPTWR